MVDKEVIIVSIIIIIVLIIFISAWSYSLNKNYLNTPVVNFSKPSEHDTNPPKILLEAYQLDTVQNSSGYKKAYLHQPCVPKTNNYGVPNLPNLPNSYFHNCSYGQACVDILTDGFTCLSKPGFFCKNKLDCDPTSSDECLNNICISKVTTLNKPCNDNSDCISDNNNDNLSCVQIDSDKRCKYDLYPLGKNCSDDLDCYPDSENQEYECVSKGLIDDYIVVGTGAPNDRIVLNEGMSILVYSFVNNIDGKKVKIINNSDDSKVSRFQITNFDLSNYSFQPIYYPNEHISIPITEGTCYNIVFYEGTNVSLNTCVSKINAGGKISAIENKYLKELMSSLDKPCNSDSETISFGGDLYCEYISEVEFKEEKEKEKEKEFYINVLCDTNNKEMGCGDGHNLTEETDIPDLTCSYVESLTENTENNYNFIGNNDFKTVGRCKYPSGGLGSDCNLYIKSCQKPLLCYEEEFNNYCLQPLETQQCYFDDSCAEGFSCINHKCSPLDKNTPNGPTNNINNPGLFYFNPETNNYKKITINPSNSLENIDSSYQNTKIIIGQQHQENNVKKICIYDKEGGDIYVLDYVSEDNYNCKKISISYLNINNITVTIDPDDKILLILKENIKTVRKRSYKINSTAFGFLTLGYHNLSVGTSVFYSGIDGSINDKNIYTVGAANDLQISLEGVISYGSSVLGNYIITYDNVVSYNSLTPGSWVEDKGIGYCTDNDIEYSWVHTGDMFKLTNGTLGISGNIADIGPSVTLHTDQDNLYFYTEISKSTNTTNKYSYYDISDDYNASEGSVPFINGNKYIGQSMQYSNDKVHASLYDGLVSYSLIPVDETQQSIIVNNSENYITKQGGSVFKNGMDTGGVTYAFDNDIELEFKTYKRNNENYFLILSSIETEVLEIGTSIVTKNINYVQNVKYSIGNSWNTDYDYQYKNQSSTCWINFTYQNNSLLPNSKNFYDSSEIYDGNISFNTVNNIYPNIYTIQEDDDLNIYSGEINNDITQTETNINIINESKFRKLETNFSQTEDPTEKLTFKGIDNAFNIPPVPLSGDLVSIFKAKSDNNTFVSAENILTFNDPVDIDLILKYGSSEIAIVKDFDVNELRQANGSRPIPYIGDGNFLPSWFTDTSGNTIRRVKEHFVKGNVNIILIITDIISHTVDLDSEQLICRINRPVNYNDNSPEVFKNDEINKLNNSFDTYIINSNTKWKFYFYNYIPLSYKYTKFETTDSIPIISIFDSSPLYTSGKNNNFYQNYSGLYSRCSYNKIIFPEENNSGYTITNNFDGMGVKYEPPIKIGTLTRSADQNNYDTNAIFSDLTNATGGTHNLFLVGLENGSAVFPNTNTFTDDFSDDRNLSYFYPSSPFGCFQIIYLLCVLYDPYGTNDIFKSMFGNGFFGNSKENAINPPTYLETVFVRDLRKPVDTSIQISRYSLVLGSMNTGVISNIFPSDSFNDQKSMYTINNLFMSTLNYASNLNIGKVIYNNKELFNSFIVSTQASSDGKKKMKGALKLNLDSMPIVIQKNNDPVIIALDQTNVDAINWPSWINLLNNNNNKYAHKIENIFYNSGNINDSSKATYYVYTSYLDNLGNNKYQMYYFGVNETVQDQILNKGVTTGPGIEFYNTRNLEMDSLSRRLYLIAN